MGIRDPYLEPSVPASCWRAVLSFCGLQFHPASHEVEITMEIVKHGSYVEVLEPAWLRERVGRELVFAAARYS